MIEKKYSDNFLKQIKNINLVSYLQANNYTLKREGTTHRYNKTIIIKKNHYYNNTKNTNGNIIDFLIEFEELTFKEAVEKLSEYQGIGYQEEEVIRNDFQIDFSIYPSRVIAYLNKKRKIDYNIIKKLIDAKMIVQDVRGNALFIMYDESKTIVGAELCGTGDKKFKGVMKDSTYGYGFNIIIGIPKNAFFFESAVDLLSFIQIHKGRVKDAILISLSGLKSNILDNTFTKYKIKSKNTYLCVDQDIAGTNFIRETKIKYADICIHRTDKQFKDWNEQLISLAQGEFINDK